MIQMISDTHFELTTRGHTMTLSATRGSGWVMVTRNASTRAFNGRLGSYKHFGTLAEVENHYRSWRGLSILVAATANQRTQL
jgi:hypothetical protein